MKIKRILLSTLGVLTLAALASCGESEAASSSAKAQNLEAYTPNIEVQSPNVEVGGPNVEVQSPNVNVNNNITVVGANGDKVDSSKLKYVFLFIGDGMSYPQIQSAQYYLSSLASNLDSGDKKTGTVLQNTESLGFTSFSSTGSAQTYDATSFAPDSASTATSLSTGKKTWSGSINMSTGLTTKYETISEKLKNQRDFKIGIVSSVNINHATPAAFYAHQASRSSYDAISDELINSDFDYFAGGKLLGKESDAKYQAAEAKGYKVCDTQEEASSLTNGDKALVVAETLADGNAMSYAIDKKNDEWALKDYVKKGIEVLNNDDGFFMMCEGGKIDWACHANDAATSIHDTIDFAYAVDEAYKFYESHSDETLIIVTGDHETGGLSIGYAGTNYDTYMTNLQNQKISYAKYDSDYVKNYVTNQTSFEDAMKDVKNLFGLVTEANKGDSRAQLVLTSEELTKLEESYKQTLKSSDKKELSATESKLLYGGYTPFSVTLTHILNNKSGIAFTSYSHTGLPTAVFAEGVGATLFEGYYDNTNIYNNMANLLGVK